MRGARGIRAATLLCGVLLTACGRPAAPPYGAEEQRAEARVATESLGRALREHAIVPACGTPLPEERPRFALLVNARQALSCRDLGYLLRRVGPSTESTATAPWLFVPSADTAAVCPFLWQEKVHLPVAVITAEAEELRKVRTVTMARFTAGTADTTYYAPTGREVLLKYQQDRSNSVVLASPTTPY